MRISVEEEPKINLIDMLEVFGKYYPWSREAIKEHVTDRLLAGAELTICSKDKTAWVNKWQKNPKEINYDLAIFFVTIGLVGIDSGNWETGETHYTFAMR